MTLDLQSCKKYENMKTICFIERLFSKNCVILIETFATILHGVHCYCMEKKVNFYVPRFCKNWVGFDLNRNFEDWLLKWKILDGIVIGLQIRKVSFSFDSGSNFKSY